MGRLEQSGELTEFISVFCVDCGSNSISQSGGLAWFGLVNKLCERDQLSRLQALRGVPREAL